MPKPGRQQGKSTTRDDIIVAARAAFARSGFQKATLRGIAAAAGVDVALVMHYFGSKEQLFIEVMRPLVEQDFDAIIATLQRAPTLDDLPDVWAGLVASALSDAAFRDLMTGVIRAATSEPKAADMLREIIVARVMRMLGRFMPEPEATLRATFIGSTLVGILVVRQIIKVPPLSQLDPQAIAGYIRPVLRHYLTMPLR